LLFSIYKVFASKEQSQELANKYRAGIGWGNVKELLYSQLEQYLCEKRNKYQTLMKQPETIHRILQEGAHKARKIAQPMIQKIRQTVGTTHRS